MLIAMLSYAPAEAQDMNVDSLELLLRDAKEDTIKANILGEISFRSAFNQPDKGLLYAKRGLDLSQKLNYTRGMASAYNGMSWCLWAKGFYNNSLYEALKALHLYEEVKDNERIAWMYLVLANVYRDIGDYSKALENAQKSIQKYKSLRLSAKVPIAVAGSTYELLNKLDSAQYYVQQAYELDVEETGGVWGWLPYLLGNIQAKLKNYDAALSLYREAIPLAIKGNISKDVADIYNSMGVVFMETGQVDSAIYYTNEVLQKWTSTAYQKGALQAATILAEAYKKRNEKDSTIKYLELSVALNNKLFALEKERDIQNLTFNEQLRQEEIERERQQFRSQIRLYGILTVGAVLLGIGLLHWRHNQQREKAKLLLQEQKQRTRQEQLKADLKIQQIESDKLRELDSMKSRFFTNISHEFRTPLSLIKGTVEKLDRENPSSANQHDLQLISRNADRLLQLINQLMDLSKLEAGKLSLQQQPGEIYSFLKALVGSFNLLFQQKQVSYRSRFPDEPLWVRFDANKLEVIFTNLLSNALKFTPAGGEVILVVEEAEMVAFRCSLKVTLQDSGIGIPADQLPKIFDRFHQVDASNTRSYEGTGIGLALVKELVELHGGEIKVNSAENKGTTFQICLPLELATERIEIAATEQAVGDIPQEAGLAQHSTTFPVPVYTSARPQTARVLVVEDHVELRNFICSQLTSDYDVLQAEDGLKAYELALDAVPDLVVSDLMMPGMDGGSLCQKLKADVRTSHIPIVLLTAKADWESKLQGLQTGADDYLTKPFKVEELRVRMKNLLDSRAKLRERFSKQISLNPQEVTVTSTDERFLQRALSIMEANMGNAKFDVEAFSREIGLSRTHLHRKLTALTGQSPNEFIRTIRLKRAASLLHQHQGNNSEIAYAVGFNTLNYFTKCFKDFYGVTPSEYAHKGAPSDAGGH